MNLVQTPKANYPRRILAIFGDLSSGKETMANYLQSKYSYELFKSSSSSSSSLIPKDIINNMTKMKICFYPSLPEEDLDLLLTKASFQVVYITSPIKIRLNNYKFKHNKEIDNFISDDYTESSSPYLLKVKSKAKFIINNADSLESFYTKIDDLILNVNKLRPNWDDYFMSIAKGVELRSNCAKTKIGAIITNKDNRIISVGYNGTASKIANCYEGECPRCWSNLQSGQDLDKCICIHAEENALLEAGREKCIGAKLYTTVLPCLTCAKNIIQCGIEEVIYDANYDSVMTKKIFEVAKVKLTKWKPDITYVF